MSQLTATPTQAAPIPLDKLCSSIRGKLQFMDYLVRAAVADVDRFDAEADPGTRIFLRQLIEMHSSNLAVECEIPPAAVPPRATFISPELIRSLAEVKGQAQFLLYLADQIEDSLHQL